MHDPFWKSAKILLNFKRPLAGALAGALLAAVCFGAGIGMVLPALYMLLEKQESVTDLINQKLVGDERPWVSDLGSWLASYVPSDPFSAFVLVMAVITGLALVGSLGRYIHELITITVVERAAMVWRGRMFRKLIHAPLLELQLAGTADHISRVAFDTRPLARAYRVLLGKTVSKVLNGAVAITLAFLFNWRLCMIAVVVVCPIAVLLRRFGKRIRRATQRALRHRGRMIGVLNESVGDIRVVKVHNAEGYERRRFGRINRRLFAEEMKVRSIRALSSPLVETIGLIGIVVVAAIAAHLIFNRSQSPQLFMAALVALGAAANSLKPLATINNQINEGRAAAGRLYDLLAFAAEPTGPDARHDLPLLARHQRSIVFNDVTFRYAQQPQPALDHLSLTIEHGQTVAIVGGNGSGKTTLASLVPRLIEPQSGHVLIDGMDIVRVRLSSLRRQISVVTQQTVLFEGTIAENIAYGRRFESRQKIEAAAKAAFADEFIRQLPNGYDGVLGEQGEGLSGGQRQRIAIARAVLRDPAILILDEATSQIDTESESKINQALRDFRHGRTVFVIAHRLSTIIDADHIIVLEAGRIIDQGTHDQLLPRCRLYQSMTHAQLQKSTAGA